MEQVRDEIVDGNSEGARRFTIAKRLKTDNFRKKSVLENHEISSLYRVYSFIFQPIILQSEQNIFKQ